MFCINLLEKYSTIISTFFKKRIVLFPVLVVFLSLCILIANTEGALGNPVFQEVEVASGLDSNARTSIAVDSSGTPHISGVLSGSGLTHFTLSGGIWKNELVDASGRCSTILMGADGQPKIVYASENGISCASRDSSGTWRKSAISTVFGWPHWAAVGPDGRVHVVYTVDSGTSGQVGLWYAEADAGATQWSFTRISANYSYRIPWIGVAGDGTVQVLREEQGSLWMSRKTSSGWEHSKLYTPAGGLGLNWFSGVITENGALRVVITESYYIGPDDNVIIGVGHYYSFLRWGTVIGTYLNFEGHEEEMYWDYWKDNENLPVTAWHGDLVVSDNWNVDSKPVIRTCSGNILATLNHSLHSPSMVSFASGAIDKIHAAFVSSDGHLVYVNVTTEIKPVTGVSLSPGTLTLEAGGPSGALVADVTPFDATNKEVTWSSCDPAVARVDSTGNITPVAAGRATITATTSDGGFKASCEVTVGPDITPPKVVQSDPANDSSNISINKSISLVFSESVQAGANFNGIAVKSGDVEINCTTRISEECSSTLIVSPVNNLAYNTTYTVTVPVGAVNDLSGNALATPYILSFTTEDDPAPPVVIASDPDNTTENVPINKAITVTFSEEVQPGDAYNNIEISNSVPFTKNIAGGNLTLIPNANLAYGTQYTVVIPAGALKDSTGNSLASNYTLNFTTESAPSTNGKVAGNLTLQGLTPGSFAGITVELFNPENTKVSTTATKADGSYEFTDIPAGTYTVIIAAGDDNYLSSKTNNVTATAGQTTTLNTVILTAGDVNGDDIIGGLDFSDLLTAWNKSIGQQGYNSKCDLNGDGKIGGLDYSSLLTNWNKKGSTIPQ